MQVIHSEVIMSMREWSYQMAATVQVIEKWLSERFRVAVTFF